MIRGGYSMNNDAGMNQKYLGNSDVWSSAGPREAMCQVTDLCRRGLSLECDLSADGKSFVSKGSKQEGILSLTGNLTDDSLITLRIALAEGRDSSRVPSGPFFRHLSSLGSRIRICPPVIGAYNEVTLSVELDVKAVPMSVSREAALLGEITRIDELARALQSELPKQATDKDLLQKYKEFADLLSPVLPFSAEQRGELQGLMQWSEEITSLLAGSLSVAIVSSFPVMTDISLSALAYSLRERGDSLALFSPPAVGVKNIADLALKAPGIVAFPAMSITLGSNLYDMGKETASLLAGLESIQKPGIFTGPLDQLQSVFHGGQGAVHNPLSPVVSHVPEIPFQPLIRFALRAAGRHSGGLSAAEEGELGKRLQDELQHLSSADQKRILPIIAKKTVQTHLSGWKSAGDSSPSYLSKILGFTETLAGLSPRPRAARLPEVQERFVKALTDPGLLTYFQKNLLAQDSALEQLVTRLSMEVLTRPLHQPIRYFAQGTPATGKSESAVLLAARLGIPYINIDAASMPDYHTAASQLLGSGRGIVMSYQAGRLEQAAKHHTGVVIEVSDLDHATPSVRSMLADLFLQALETGEAQSATGSMFPLSNVIFAFTMNLPDGADEAVRKGIGFNNSPSQEEVAKRVISEIKEMLSGAFLSRVGTPILFEPLSGDALSTILERTLMTAVTSAAARLGMESWHITTAGGLGQRILSSMKRNILSFGARAILEHGRTLAAEAFIEFIRTANLKETGSIKVSATPEGRLLIIPDPNS